MNTDRFADATFRKASGSGDAGCVAVAFVAGATGVRDSKRPGGGVLCFTTDEWSTFLDRTRNGQLDLPTHP